MVKENYRIQQLTEQIIEQITEQIDKLQKENEKMKKCIEYYADKNNWDTTYSKYYGAGSMIIKDFKWFNNEKKYIGGQRARKCLKQLKEK